MHGGGDGQTAHRRNKDTLSQWRGRRRACSYLLHGGCIPQERELDTQAQHHCSLERGMAFRSIKQRLPQS